MPDYKHIFLAFLEFVADAGKQATFVNEDITTLVFDNPQPDDPTVEQIVARANEISAAFGLGDN
jgi:hypothetical protein